MSDFTMDDLRRVLRTAAGDSGTLDSDIADVPFSDLGYDSLALLELASRIGREYHVPISDDAVFEMRTPGLAVAYVNDRLATNA